ncbi:F-actin-capping protein subunit alpha-2-like [Acanthaster planci]|uniref:F-actin-capping protein subunit alpha n=1 Tax=Acanthaster planci TaxID=133434 RepID=A0A8B7Z1B7_ACAPL|nr:F-actin-capping protein subunit alpha-2-like [Acanthaster planci]
MADLEPISDQEKVRIASSFIRHIPPGEFNEVFNSVRTLVNNDKLLKDQVVDAIAQYNNEQLTPCKVDNEMVLITEHGNVGGNRYVAPNLKKSFKYDHLRKESSDIDSHAVNEMAEPWRAAMDKAIIAHVKDHFPNGVHTVYGKSDGDAVTLIVCIEDHKFSPHNFWNGRWRSQFSTTFTGPGTKAEVKGIMKTQVHYYEDGNVQLVSHKEIKEQISISDEAATAKAILNVIEKAENDYQSSMVDDYKVMSETTFKALRRQLPITRSRIDWNKISDYKLGQELKGAEAD